METTQRNVRINDEVWAKAQKRVKAEGTTISAVVRDFLKAYGDDDGGVEEELTRIADRLERAAHRLR